MTQAAAIPLLAQQLLAAREQRVMLDQVGSESLPNSAAEAYQVQQATIAALGGAGAYKIGAKTPQDAPQYSPIPASKVFTGQPEIACRDFNRVGLELEIAFRFKSDIGPAQAGLSDAAILEQIAQMIVTAEIVDSRFKHWPQIDKLAQLADLQNNGALVVGDAVPYDRNFDFNAPLLKFSCGPQQIIAGPGSNPAGDPRRLLVWLVRTRLEAGQTIAASAVLTAGSYSGIYFAPGPDPVVGEIAGIGRVAFNLV